MYLAVGVLWPPRAQGPGRRALRLHALVRTAQGVVGVGDGLELVVRLAREFSERVRHVAPCAGILVAGGGHGPADVDCPARHVPGRVGNRGELAERQVRMARCPLRAVMCVQSAAASGCARDRSSIHASQLVQPPAQRAACARSLANRVVRGETSGKTKLYLGHMGYNTKLAAILPDHRTDPKRYDHTLGKSIP